MKSQPLVSIVIPTYNSELFLENCLQSIQNQTYKNIETILVDSNSHDDTLKIAKKFNTIVLNYAPKVSVGKFDAPHKRNYGVEKSSGKFVYYVDADMVLPEKLIQEIVDIFSKTDVEALVVPEDSFGIGIWAQAKQLERRCYWGDDTVEAARVFSKKAWDSLGGLDTSLGGGGDDWDLHYRLLSSGFSVGRTQTVVLHNEGNLKLSKLIKKRFMYGRDSVKYLVKRPKASIVSYFPIRMAYIRNWRMLLSSPGNFTAFLVMRSLEYAAGFAGIIYSRFEYEK